MKNGYSPYQFISGKKTIICQILQEICLPELETENLEFKMMKENFVMRRASEKYKARIRRENKKGHYCILQGNIKLKMTKLTTKITIRKNKKRRGSAKVIGLDVKTVIIKHGGTLIQKTRVHISRISKAEEIQGVEKDEMKNKENEKDDDHDEYDK